MPGVYQRWHIGNSRTPNRRDLDFEYEALATEINLKSATESSIMNFSLKPFHPETTDASDNLYFLNGNRSIFYHRFFSGQGNLHRAQGIRSCNGNFTVVLNCVQEGCHFIDV